MNILYQSDDNYAPYMGISITSLLMNKKKDSRVDIYILDGGISDENKDKIKVTCEKYGANVTYLLCSEIEKKIEQSGVQKYRGSYATFYKLYLNEILPKHIERILYIDCDTVIKKDLEELYNIDMGEYPLAMAEDLLIYQYKKKLGYAPKDVYFNAGVVLYNLKNMSNGNWWDRLKKFLEEYPISELMKHEQDIINLCFKNSIYKLPLRFNAQSLLAAGTAKQIKLVYGKCINYSSEEMQEEFDNAVICHFLDFGGGQPWVKNSMHPYRMEFISYKVESVWNESEDISINRSIIIKSETFLYNHSPRVFFLTFFKISHDLLQVV